MFEPALPALVKSAIVLAGSLLLSWATTIALRKFRLWWRGLSDVVQSQPCIGLDVCACCKRPVVRAGTRSHARHRSAEDYQDCGAVCAGRHRSGGATPG